MRSYFITFLLFLIVMGCKTAPINQKVNNKKEGVWIENYYDDTTEYKSIGKYHLDEPIKKWRYYLKGKIIKKEKYKKNNCRIINYFENGKIQSKGQTKTTTDSIETHWFYDGDWKYYNEKGKLIAKRKYKNSNLVMETEFEK
jgi:antitoxin component YwqK of YwqJK toxin-antitoxin module